jgi:1-acyl-sn-glycerol-3-phosphate acyltransferase
MGKGWYWFVRRVIQFIVPILAHHEIVGQENVPKSGPYIIITNHLSLFDPPVILSALPVKTRVFAGHSWRIHPIFGPLLSSMDVIWVRRGEVDRKALKEASAYLEAGGILSLAVEGTRSRSGGLQRGKSGAAYIALRHDVPILPVVVTGTERVFRELLHLRRARLKTVFGAPFRLPQPDGRLRGEDLDEATDQIMLSLARLLPERYRGVYQNDPRL